jgi:hypothetical protein
MERCSAETSCDGTINGQERKEVQTCACVDSIDGSYSLTFSSALGGLKYLS